MALAAPALSLRTVSAALEGDNGFLFPPGDVGSLAECLRAAADRPA